MRVQFEGKANLGGWNLRSVAEVPGCDGIVRTHQCVSQWWWFISVEEDGKRQAGPGGGCPVGAVGSGPCSGCQ